MSKAVLNSRRPEPAAHVRAALPSYTSNPSHTGGVETAGRSTDRLQHPLRFVRHLQVLDLLDSTVWLGCLGTLPLRRAELALLTGEAQEGEAQQLGKRKFRLLLEYAACVPGA